MSPGRIRSAQTLDETSRRLLAEWAAECAARVLPLFERGPNADPRPRDGIARALAFSRGELDTASQIRRRFEAGRAAATALDPAGAAAARSAGQASAVAHVGAHALGAAAYAALAVQLSTTCRPDRSMRPAMSTRNERVEQKRPVDQPHTSGSSVTSVDAEIAVQLALLTPDARDALRMLPPVGIDRSGPLGPGLLSRGDLGRFVRALQSAVAEP